MIASAAISRIPSNLASSARASIAFGRAGVVIPEYTAALRRSPRLVLPLEAPLLRLHWCGGDEQRALRTPYQLARHAPDEQARQHVQSMGSRDDHVHALRPCPVEQRTRRVSIECG